MDDATAEEMIALLPRLKRFAFSLTGSRSDAEDLVQRTCERAIAQIGRYRPGTRLDSWMYRIAQNLHRNDLRNNRVRSGHLRTVENDAADLHTPANGVDRLALGEIGAMIARLPSDQRAALLLVAVEGHAYGEAADILGTSPGTIASRVSRARATLAALYSGGRDDPSL